MVEQLQGGRLGRITDCKIEPLFHAIDEMLASRQLRQSFIKQLKKDVVGDMQGVKIFLSELDYE